LWQQRLGGLGPPLPRGVQTHQDCSKASQNLCFCPCHPCFCYSKGNIKCEGFGRGAAAQGGKREVGSNPTLQPPPQLLDYSSHGPRHAWIWHVSRSKGAFGNPSQNSTRGALKNQPAAPVATTAASPKCMSASRAAALSHPQIRPTHQNQTPWASKLARRWKPQVLRWGCRCSCALAILA